jgi:membrane fusion protein (multidrug efflux system)
LSKKAQQGGAADLLHSSSRVPIELTLSNGAVYSDKGRIVFVDRQVNTSTGTIRVAAAFPNPQNLLRPGQYGKVRAQTSIEHNALLVPQRAVTELQGSYQVAVVNADNKVHIQPVEIGPQIAEGWVITSGLKLGDQVVIEGNGKLADGMPVHPHPAQANADQPETGPGDAAKPSASSSEGK